jgi:lipopolysaccharide biosynthesis protein
MDYYIVVNGPTDVKFPNHVNVIYRENKGFDFGAYSECLEKIPKQIHYNYYVFINSSVQGPYPTGTDWFRQFKNLFSHDTKLVGTSINIHTYSHETNAQLFKHNGPYTHVQSMFFAMDSECFEFLKSRDFFECDECLTKDHVIGYKEIMMSQLVLQNGWNINCILNGYRDKDYRTIQANFNASSEKDYGDPYYVGNYFGGTIRPEQVVFFKTNRNIPKN